MLPIIYENEKYVLAGVDECGRGCFAGPVCAAVVVWPKDFQPQSLSEEKMLDMVRDSKKVSAPKRELLAEFIKKYALDYKIVLVDNETVDAINILQSTYKAMHSALDQIEVEFDRVVVDGNNFKNYIKNSKFIPHICIVKGDDVLFQIAAASILAKTYRDKYITDLGNSNERLKVYKWEKNKGYGTKQHIEAIKEFGQSEYHRKTFIHF
jgi:ribonuclease HII